MFMKTLKTAALLGGMQLLSTVEAGKFDLSPRDNICPANPPVVAVTIIDQIIEYPIYISTYIATNQDITINGGVTINVNEAPTALVTTTVGTTTSTITVTATVTVAPSVNFVFGFQGTPGARRRAVGQQFIGAAGGTTGSCAAGMVFSINSASQLVNENTNTIVSTSPGLGFLPVGVSSGGNISTTVSAPGGIFQWLNPAFTSGAATFCQRTDGEVDFVFVQPAPLGCTSVVLTAIATTDCGAYTSSSSYSNTTTTTS